VNNLYFACTACHVFIDAGYRHAYWTLEHAGVVSTNAPVDIREVLDAEEYWAVDDVEWLIKLLPAVRGFLEAHRTHDVRFGDGENLGPTPMFDGDYRLFDWLMDAGYVYKELPRYYVERLGFRRWAQVVEHVETTRDGPPWWWLDEEYREQARKKFLALVAECKDDHFSDAV